MPFILLSIILLFSNPAMAQMKDVETSTTGYGSTYETALNQALIQAVQQVRGTAIATDKQAQIAIDSITSLGGSSQSFRLNEEQRVSADSRGWIKSYRITQVKEPNGEDGNWPVHDTVVEI